MSVAALIGPLVLLVVSARLVVTAFGGDSCCCPSAVNATFFYGFNHFFTCDG